MGHLTSQNVIQVPGRLNPNRMACFWFAFYDPNRMVCFWFAFYAMRLMQSFPLILSGGTSAFCQSSLSSADAPLSVCVFVDVGLMQSQHAAPIRDDRSGFVASVPHVGRTASLTSESGHF